MADVSTTTKDTNEMGRVRVCEGKMTRGHEHEQIQAVNLKDIFNDSPTEH